MSSIAHTSTNHIHRTPLSFSGDAFYKVLQWPTLGNRVVDLVCREVAFAAICVTALVEQSVRCIFIILSCGYISSKPLLELRDVYIFSLVALWENLTLQPLDFSAYEVIFPSVNKVISAFDKNKLRSTDDTVFTPKKATPSILHRFPYDDVALLVAVAGGIYFLFLYSQASINSPLSTVNPQSCIESIGFPGFASWLSEKKASQIFRCLPDIESLKCKTLGSTYRKLAAKIGSETAQLYLNAAHEILKKKCGR